MTSTSPNSSESQGQKVPLSFLSPSTSPTPSVQGVAKSTSDRVSVNLETIQLFETLHDRFDQNVNLHEGIEWKDVEAALKKNPDLIVALERMEAEGGKVDVLKETPNSFIFVETAKEMPDSRCDFVYDAGATASLKMDNPEDVNAGNVIDTIKAWGGKDVRLINESEYRELQSKVKTDKKKAVWIATDPSNRNVSGKARVGSSKFGAVRIEERSVISHSSDLAFRCALTVPKVAQVQFKNLTN